MTHQHSLIHITDCHINARSKHHGGDTRDMYRTVMTMIQANEAPDMVIVTGDLADDGSLDAYQWLRHELAAYNCPVMTLPGNHDDRGNMSKTFATDQFIHGMPHKLGKWLIIPLDSLLPGEESGHLTTAELERLDRALAQHGDNPALVALHHPPVEIGCNWLDAMRLDNAEQLFGIIQRHTAACTILCGHVHQAVDMVHRDIRIISSPATCRQFLPNSPRFTIDPSPAGYRRLVLDDTGGIETQVLRLDAENWANCLQHT